MKPCDEVTERVALGDPIGELADHVATCERCQRLTALPGELAAVPHEAPPSVGFTARMTVGAQHVLAARKRRRIVGSVAAATAVAAGAAIILTRSPDEPAAPQPAVQDMAKQDEPVQPDELKALVKLARYDRASDASANWSHITKPLAPYKAVVKGVKP